MTDSNPRCFRLLVVDDDRDILEFFRQILCYEKSNLSIHSESDISAVKNDFRTTPNLVLEPFDVVTCQQGDEAVDAVKNAVKEGRPFSVVFIDIRMPPGPDGIWTLEHIRTLDPNIEIVIMTGYSDADPFSIASRVPPIHKLLYLKKPLDMNEIHQFASALSMKWHTECELQRVNKGLEESVEARIQELKESERHFKNFLENLGDIAYEIDPSGNVTYTNKAAEILTGKK